MRVLIFHGYLLRGTGSNVYNASLAATLARLGHEVHLLCQEHEPVAFPAGPGSVTVHRPPIGGLLPVFVRDRYEGFRVKTFGELTDAELGRYLEANVGAVADLVAELGGVDAALANHLVMGPVILARAGLRYALKVHGSDLSYTVLPERERFLPYVEEAVAGANGILVGSSHIAARLRAAIDRPEVDAKVRLGPPGVDVERFAPVALDRRAPRLLELGRRLRSIGAATGREDAGGGAWDRDPAVAAEAVEWFARSAGPRVVFVGKLIVSKGVDLLLATWPLVRQASPQARLLIVGFGALEDPLRAAWAGLERGDLAAIRALAERGRGLEGEQQARPLPLLTAFLERQGRAYAEAARAAAGSVAFAGRLDHDEVADLLPACEALVFPSTFPEAFGMVAAEAAAAGALPISAAHSGAAEVSRELAAALPPDLARLVGFRLDGEPGPVEAITERLGAWFELPAGRREPARQALRETVVRRWSWARVADDVLAAAAGRLDGLATPTAPSE